MHEQSVFDLLGEQIEYEVKAEGHKSSEGDGRTAADIEAENARAEVERGDQ